MVGILVEKSSAEDNFIKAFGRKSGTCNGEQYTIVASKGHLYEFVEPEKQVIPALASKYKSWNETELPWDENDFSWKRKRKSGATKKLDNIKKVLSTCDEIVIATDNDPSGEGDLLAWEILSELHLVRGKKITRMRFEDESKKKILEAFVNRVFIPDMNTNAEYRKALFRTKWDFLSMQFTRIATLCCGEKLVIREGRLKSLMIKLVGDQLKAVSEYKKIPYYINKFKDENGNVYTSAEEPIYPKKEDVPQKYGSSEVIIDSKIIKSSPPPKMIDLMGLASELAPKGFSGAIIESTYQKMYQDEVVSYPRTEDEHITIEQFNELLPYVDKIADVVGVDKSLLTHRTPRSTHIRTGQAHGANRPGLKVPESLEDLKVKYGSCAPYIYDILAHSYLATLAEDYEYEQQRGHLAKYPNFKGFTNIPKSMGYKKVFNDSDEEDKKDASKSDKELGKIASPFIHETFPKKPVSPTVKWLRNQLGKYNVGTGATRLKTLTEVTKEKSKYPLMIDKRGKLTLAHCGEISYTLLENTHISSSEMTERVLSQMTSVAKGEADPNAYLHEIQQLVVDDLATMKKNSMKLRKGTVSMAAANNKEYAKGTWQGEEVSFNRVFCGHRFTDEEVEKLLNGETIEVRGLKGKNGTYGVTGNLAHQTYNGHDYVGFNRIDFINDGNIPQKEKFTGIWNGKQVSCNRVWGGDGINNGHRFTDEEVEMLLNGEEIEVYGIVSKNDPNKTYNVLGKLTEQTFKGRKFVGFENLEFLNDPE